jgi:hypothetical protein
MIRLDRLHNESREGDRPRHTSLFDGEGLSEITGVGKQPINRLTLYMVRVELPANKSFCRPDVADDYRCSRGRPLAHRGRPLVQGRQCLVK